MPVLLRYLTPFLFGLVLIEEGTEQLLRSGHNLIKMHGAKFAADNPKPLRLHEILHYSAALARAAVNCACSVEFDIAVVDAPPLEIVRLTRSK